MLRYDRFAGVAGGGAALLLSLFGVVPPAFAPSGEPSQQADDARATVAAPADATAEHREGVPAAREEGVPPAQEEGVAPGAAEAAPAAEAEAAPVGAGDDAPVEGADTSHSEDAETTPAGGAGVDAVDGSPLSVVTQFHEVILGVLRQVDELGYDERLARLAPAIDDTFDLHYMATKVIGRRWNTLGPPDQEQWLQTFAQLTKATYAGRFNAYSGETFNTLGQEPGAYETVIVRTEVTGGEEDVSLTYRLHRTPTGWKIIDVYLKGTVSELALRRSEYSSVLKREGFEALVASLNRKIADLASGRVSQ